MPAYLVVNYNVENPQLYGEYAKAAGPALEVGKKCKLLAFDAETERVEGDSAGHQTVILEYPSKEEAKAAYESGAYQEVIGKRLESTSGHFAVLVEGFGG